MQLSSRSIVAIAIALLTVGDAATAAARPSKRRDGTQDPARKGARSGEAPDADRQRRTTAAVVVRRRPSAKSGAAGKLAAGAVVVIEREQGDWLRIRAGRITGYVTRASVTAPPAAGAAAPPVPGTDPAPEGDGKPTAAPEQGRKTIEAVVVRSRPGEKQAAVGTLPAGTPVIVEAEDGRWLRVRAGKLVGYVARTTVTGTAPATDTTKIEHPPVAAPEVAAASSDAPPPSRWGTSQRPGPATPMSGELFVEVTAAASLRAEARPDAAVVVELARGARVAVVAANEMPGWLHVHDGRGNDGWIPVAQAGNGAAAVAVTGALDDRGRPAVAARAAPAAIPTRRAILVRLDAAIGYRSLGMDFTSNGAGGLANYLVSADAGALDAEAVVVKRMPGRLVVGIDGRVEVSRASPGIEYPGPTAAPGKIGFSTFAGDAGVRVGLRARRVFELALRGGLHYDAFVARDVENAAMLPRERLLGATLGGRVEIAPPGSRVGATVRVDALALGSRRQTPGLEDGASSVARAVWGGVAVRVRLSRRWSLLSAYDFGRATTRWSGMSIRDPGVTEARRVDSTQLVRIGLSAEM